MSLTFVGLGLWDENDVSLRGRHAIDKADVVYAEWYTAYLGGASPDKLVAAYGRDIEFLERDPIERGDSILAEAQTKDVVLLAVGDSMTATTHVDLRVRAAKLGIATHVIHGASIATAVAGLTGLMSYKFGRATTVVFPEGEWMPTSPYEVVAANLARGLHTLTLMDLRAHEGRHMRADEGARLLLQMAEKVGDGALGPDTNALVIARAGSPEPGVWRGSLAQIAAGDFGEPLHTMVIPGDTHFMEDEAIAALCRPVGDAA